MRLSSPVMVNEIVEKWLDDLSKQMVETLKSELNKISRKSVNENSILEYPSQIICLMNEIEFQESVCRELESKTLTKYIYTKSEFLSQLTALCHKSDYLTVAKLKSLILDIIHQISILNDLKAHNVASKDDWLWRKQLKFKMQGNDVNIYMGNAEFLYTF